MGTTGQQRWIGVLVLLGACATSDSEDPCAEALCEADQGQAGSGAAVDPASSSGLGAGAGDDAKALAGPDGPYVDPADPSATVDDPSARADVATRTPFRNPPGESRCEVTELTAGCTYTDSSLNNRLVRWQVPLGDPPAGGWPAVVVYQGSAFGPDGTWQGSASMPFGGFYQVRLQARLLDNGFAVIAPAAEGGVWQTNFLPPLFFPAYEEKPDYYFVLDLLDAIEAGEYGPIDAQRLYATGVSGGGYMTSRMAVSHPGRFVGLAIQSGSYATCSGGNCSVQTNRPEDQDDMFPPFWVIPPTLPSDHPPTLFLHGSADTLVPESSMHVYDDLLVEQGFETKVVIDRAAGHGWLSVSPEEITDWFLNH